MGKTAQANVTGFQRIEDIAGGHHNPKNPEQEDTAEFFML